MRTFRLPVLSPSRFGVAAVLLAMSTVLTVAWALTVEQEAKLLASDGAEGDYSNAFNDSAGYFDSIVTPLRSRFT